MKRTFLCLTDLHYDDEKWNPSEDNKDLGKAFESVSSTAFDDLNAILEQGFERGAVDFVAVVGDITSQGNPQGFEDFQSQTTGHLDRLVSDPAAICIVPGNHDVTWFLNPHEDGYFERKFEGFANLIRTSGATSCLLPKGKLVANQRKLDFATPTPGPLYIDKNKQIIVLNINSAIRCGEIDTDLLKSICDWSKRTLVPPKSAIDPITDEDKKMLQKVVRDVAQITRQQVEHLQKLLAAAKDDLKDQWDSYLRVALVHHHVTSFPKQTVEHKTYEFMLDSSRLLAFLTAFDFDLILTGHKHHAYELVHNFEGKNIFIVGGPTVGGLSSSKTFQGIRKFTFENTENEKRLSIFNLTLEMGNGDVRSNVGGCPCEVLTIPLTAEQIVRRDSLKHGYIYREIVSTTRITGQGDGIRTLEFDDLKLIDPNHAVSSGLSITLPETSGYLDGFAIAPSGSTLEFRSPNTLPHKATSGKIDLSFRTPLRIGRGTSFELDWTAVNAFALDQREFERKYNGSHMELENVEFTHLQPPGPCGTFTMLVQFPPGCEFRSKPELVVTRPDSSEPNTRKWPRVYTVTDDLIERRAFRFFPTVGVAALRVKSPDPSLNYRIEWKLPPAKKRLNRDRTLEAVAAFEENVPVTFKILRDILISNRTVAFGDWHGDLDASLMIFGARAWPNQLKVVAAARSSFQGAKRTQERLSALAIEAMLPFGLGIAGRAFRANGIEFYTGPKDSPIEPDYYWPVPGSLTQKRLICFPLHLPAPEKEFERDQNCYSKYEPYGILNLGSQDSDCPLDDEMVKTLVGSDKMLLMQHTLNRELAPRLFGGSFNVEKGSSSVEKARNFSKESKPISTK